MAIILDSLVKRAISYFGHILVPVDVFGLTKSVLKDILQTTVNKYSEYKPITRQTLLGVTKNGTPLEAKEVIWVRDSNVYWEYSGELHGLYWNFNPLDKKIYSDIEGTYLVKYISNLTIKNNIPRKYNLTTIYNLETELHDELKERPKFGSFSITLNVPTYNPESVVFNYLNNTISINTSSDIYINAVNNSVVKFSEDLGSTLPSGILTSSNYFIYKVGNDYLFNTEPFLPKNFTVNFSTSNENIIIPNHGLLNNQYVQLLTNDTLPNGLNSLVTFKVHVVDVNTIKLKNLSDTIIQFTNNGIGIHSLVKIAYFSSNGTGSFTLKLENLTIKEVSKTTNYSILNGTLGLGYIFYNQSIINNKVYNPNEIYIQLYGGLVNEQNIVTVNYNSESVGIEDIDESENLFFDLFTGYFMLSLGLSKAITKLDGLPFDLSADDLQSKGEQMIEQTLEKISKSRGNWWEFA